MQDTDLTSRLGRRGGARVLQALRAFVRRSDDRRLERTCGSDRGLRVLLGALARRFDPVAAEGFTGEIGLELLGMDGATRSWTIVIGEQKAAVRRGPAVDPALVVRLGLSDLVRMAAGDLDPGAALLGGRLDLEGDVGVAMRLGAMFRTDGALGR